MPQVLMPQLGETVMEGTVGRWLKKAGDAVAKYEPLLEVETDKVASEIPSPFTGTLARIIAGEGSTVPVGAPVCEILAPGEAPSVPAAPPVPAAPAGEPAKPVAAQAKPQEAERPASPIVAASPSKSPLAPAPVTAQSARDGVRYSPAVRRLARMHHIDLSGLAGSGRGGRITARDVMARVQTGAAAPPPAERVQPPHPAAAAPHGGAAPAAAAPVSRPVEPARPVPPAPPLAQPTTAPIEQPAARVAQPAAPHAPTAPTVAPAAKPAPVLHAVPIAPPGPDDTVIRLSQMRRTIAERMVLSKTTIPHAWSMVEADVTNLVAWRSKEKEAFKQREGVNLTFLPVVIQAVCAAIREYPMVNATWAGDSIIQRRHINVGVAVDVEDGLVVPVVKDADRYSLAGLATTINELVTKARSRRLTMDDLSDGTITLDNTGSLGSIASVPIINPPQAAILTTEAIVKRPWVVNDAIATRHIMNLCMCLDHRVLDGAVASHFLQAVKKRLEAWTV